MKLSRRGESDIGVLLEIVSDSAEMANGLRGLCPCGKLPRLGRDIEAHQLTECRQELLVNRARLAATDRSVVDLHDREHAGTRAAEEYFVGALNLGGRDLPLAPGEAKLSGELGASGHRDSWEDGFARRGDKAFVGPIEKNIRRRCLADPAILIEQKGASTGIARAGVAIGEEIVHAAATFQVCRPAIIRHLADVADCQPLPRRILIGEASEGDRIRMQGDGRPTRARRSEGSVRSGGDEDRQPDIVPFREQRAIVLDQMPADFAEPRAGVVLSAEGESTLGGRSGFHSFTIQVR